MLSSSLNKCLTKVTLSMSFLISLRISLLSLDYSYSSRRSRITYFLITSSMKNVTAKQKNKVLISIVQESYVDSNVKTWRLILLKLYLINDATKRLNAKTNIVLHVKNKNLSFVIVAWKMYRQLLTATSNMKTAIWSAPAESGLPSLSLTCGKVNNTAPMTIPPWMTP